MKRHIMIRTLTAAASLLIAAATTAVVAEETAAPAASEAMQSDSGQDMSSGHDMSSMASSGSAEESTSGETTAAEAPAPEPVASTTPGSIEVKISKEVEFLDVTHEGSVVRIQRIQDQDHLLTGGFTKTSRPCPPFCIQPIEAAPGVTTVGELEVLQFLDNQVKNGSGVLIDARVPSWHAKGTIPGSVNIPFTLFEKDVNNTDLMNAMAKLGVTRKGADDAGMMEGLVNSLKEMLGMDVAPPSAWDFSNAKEVALWCNGMWCGQSPRAIKALLAHQYPAEKIHYYRGGMQSWTILGLSVVIPDTTTLSSL